MSSSPPSDTPLSDTPLIDYYKSKTSLTSSRRSSSSQLAPSANKEKPTKEVSQLLEFQSNFHDQKPLSKKRRSIPRISSNSNSMGPISDDEDYAMRQSPSANRHRGVLNKDLADLLQQQSYMHELGPVSGKRKSSQKALHIIRQAVVPQYEEDPFEDVDMDDYDIDDAIGAMDDANEGSAPGYAARELSKSRKQGKSKDEVGKGGSQVKGEEKGCYIGHHVDDPKLPVHARFYANGALITRIYREDVSEEIFQRYPNIFLNSQKGLVTVNKIHFAGKICEDNNNESENIQTLSDIDKRNLIRDFLHQSANKGRLIGYHIDIPTLPVYAGRYRGYKKRGQVYARVYKADTDKETLRKFPDIFSTNSGQVEINQIIFDKVFPSDTQSLSVEQKTKRIEDYLQSLATPAKDKAAAASQPVPIDTTPAMNKIIADPQIIQTDATHELDGTAAEAQPVQIPAMQEQGKTSAALQPRQTVALRELDLTAARPQSVLIAGLGETMAIEEESSEDEEDTFEAKMAKFLDFKECMKQTENAARRQFAKYEATISKLEDLCKNKDSIIQEQRGAIETIQSALAEAKEQAKGEATTIEKLQTEIKVEKANNQKLEKKSQETNDLRIKYFGGKRFKLVLDQPNTGIYVYDAIPPDGVCSSTGVYYREWLALVELKRLDLGRTDQTIVTIDGDQYRRINEEGNQHKDMLVQIGPTKITTIDGIDVFMTRIRKEA